MCHTFCPGRIVLLTLSSVVWGKESDREPGFSAPNFLKVKQALSGVWVPARYTPTSPSIRLRRGRGSWVPAGKFRFHADP